MAKNVPIAMGVDFGIINTQDSFQGFIDTMDSVISNHDTAVKLARLNFNESCGDAMGYRLAYDIRSISEEDARAEQCETATELIIKHTTLKKSMVTNYRRVGEFFTNEHGDFIVPDYTHGFSVTALYEAVAKLKTVEEVKKAIEDGTINSTMSAKNIREALMNDVEKRLKAKKDAEKAAKKEAEKAEKESEKNPFMRPEALGFLVNSDGERVAKIAVEPLDGYTVIGIAGADKCHIEFI